MLLVVSKAEILIPRVEYYVVFFDQVTALGSKNIAQVAFLKDVFERHLLEELHVKTSLNDQTSEVSLLQALLKYVLLDSVHWYESVNVYSLCLADTMATILSLLVHSWIPVSVIEDHTISSSQVDADTTAPRWRDETEDLLVEVELIHESLTHLYFHRAIKAHIRVSVQVKELLQDVEYSRHLSED